MSNPLSKMFSVYKICSPLGDLKYIGSTGLLLNDRLTHHHYAYNAWKRGSFKTSSADLFEAYGVEACVIELIEMCNTKEESLAREGFYQRTTVCVNKRIETRTQQEYRESHKEETAASAKAYYETHREEKAVYAKAYQESHKDEISVTKKAYYEIHKEQKAVYSKAYQESHKDEKAVYSKAYLSNQVNRDKMNARRRALRAEKKDSVKSA